MPKSLVALRKWPTRSSAIARMVAHVGRLHEAVVEHQGDAARVGAAAAAAEAHRPVAAGVGRLELELHVVGEALDLDQLAAAAVERAQAELGEVGHEDVGEVDRAPRRPASDSSATIGRAISTESV